MLPAGSKEDGRHGPTGPGVINRGLSPHPGLVVVYRDIKYDLLQWV